MSGQAEARIICVSDHLGRDPAGPARQSLVAAFPNVEFVQASDLYHNPGPSAVPDVLFCDLDAVEFDPFALMDRTRFMRPVPLICAVGGKSDAALGFRLFGRAHIRFVSWDAIVAEGALEPHLWLRRRLLDVDMLSFVRQLRRLPVMPDTFATFRQALRNPVISLADISSAIERDPAAAAQILRVANSGYFSVGRQLRRIADAVSLLGSDLVGSLLLAFGLFTGAGNVRVGDLSAARLLNHSLLTASVARLIALGEGLRELADDAFLAGILHDMGLYALMLNQPVRLSDVAEMRAQGMGQCAAEETVFGLDHAALGGAILLHWNLPFSIVQAIYNHHIPSRRPESGNDLTRILHVAAVLASEVDGMDEEWDPAAGQPLRLDRALDEYRAQCQEIHRIVSVA